LSEDERVRALELMEMQRHAQLMYTSCGWFFDDISGIETVQIIAYAARVLQLARCCSARRRRAWSRRFWRGWRRRSQTWRTPGMVRKDLQSVRGGDGTGA
jgi:hypothetical protein